jgi:cytidylate kinase
VVIAIDGPAGSGKSTIAKLLAEKLGAPGRPFTYINSGNLYRAITLGCVRRGIPVTDAGKVLEYAGKAVIEYRGEDVYLDGENVASLLHSDEVDREVSPLSSIVPVRRLVNDLVRKAAQGICAVAEGRDMTTVVFPDAEYRFYLDASPEARARRRRDQGVSRLALEDIRKAIEERDDLDRNKTEGSLKIADGAVYLDTSDLTISQVYERLIDTIKLKG